MLQASGADVHDPHQAVVASVHEGGVVLLHTGSGQMFAANRTGAFIWQCVERHLPLDAIVDALGRQYDIQDEAAAAHARRFLDTLLSRGLVTRAEG